MKVVIKKSEKHISKEAKYKIETSELITRERIYFLSFKVSGNKVTAI